MCEWYSNANVSFIVNAFDSLHTTKNSTHVQTGHQIDTLKCRHKAEIEVNIAKYVKWLFDYTRSHANSHDMVSATVPNMTVFTN